jgi:hypothetical protein
MGMSRARRGSRKKVTERGNKKTVVVTLRSIIASRAFQDGYRDAMRGKPWNGDSYMDDKAWSYERGRQFASLYSGQIKAGRDVLPEAYSAFREACRSRDIL